ncbi:hypothetical protein E4U21_007353 [Claviceps maximensis]|nr:hypothetical protein E4U21_007353 [Claviceps maximensis]
MQWEKARPPWKLQTGAVKDGNFPTLQGVSSCSVFEVLAHLQLGSIVEYVARNSGYLTELPYSGSRNGRQRSEKTSAKIPGKQ